MILITYDFVLISIFFICIRISVPNFTNLLFFLV